MSNRFNKQRKSEPFRRQDNPEDMNTGNEKSPDDPRVRAFVRSYAPIVNIEDPAATSFTQPQLRSLFNAYQTANGYDPMVKILNQLENHGFELQANPYKDELILPVKRIKYCLTSGMKIKLEDEPN